MANIYDLADPQELIGYVRAILDEQNRNPLLLASILPNKTIEGIEYRLTQGSIRDQAAAPVRAFDTPAPIAKRQGIGRKSGELLPISKKINMTEEGTIRKRAIESGSNQRLIDAIFDDAANMARAVLVRVEQLRGEALWSGKIELMENDVRQTLDFARDASLTVAPGTLWSNAAAPVVNDVMAWVATYKGLNGILPAFALISTRILGYLSLNTQLRTLATFNGVTPIFLGLNEINRLLAVNNLPAFVVNDELVRDYTDTQVRVIPDDKVVFLPPSSEPLGNTLWGETAESIALVEAKQIAVAQAPGLVAVVTADDDPVGTWTKVASVVMPILANPNLTMTADVA